MQYRSGAWVVVGTHLGYIGFLLGGGWVAGRSRRLLIAHLGSVATAIVIYGAGLDCPLTELEKWLIRRAGGTPYEGGFVEHYLVVPLLSRPITPSIRIGTAVAVTLTVAASYARLLGKGRTRTRAT